MATTPNRWSFLVTAIGLGLLAGLVLVLYPRLSPQLQPFLLRLIPASFFYVIYRQAGQLLQFRVERGPQPLTPRGPSFWARLRLRLRRRGITTNIPQYEEIRRKLTLIKGSKEYRVRMLRSLGVDDELLAQFTGGDQEEITEADVAAILHRLEEQL
ncbi:MAG: hypothetical protein GX030_09610 [Firmicutes bacterium]|nr:hypothetical protein [Bacillota bacterium]